MPTECLIKYIPPPNFREIYESFNMEFSVTWRSKVLPVSLSARDLYLDVTLSAPVRRLLETYLFTTQYPFCCSDSSRREREKGGGLDIFEAIRFTDKLHGKHFLQIPTTLGVYLFSAKFSISV
jgi:hypothetical protein